MLASVTTDPEPSHARARTSPRRGPARRAAGRRGPRRSRSSAGCDPELRPVRSPAAGAAAPGRGRVPAEHPGAHPAAREARLGARPVQRAQRPPDLGQPRGPGGDPVRAGGAVAAAAEHGVRRRGAVPVRRPHGDRAPAARRARCRAPTPPTSPASPVLYPVLAAAANSLGGLAAARAVSLRRDAGHHRLLYAMTRRLFNERVGLCAAVLFCVTEGTILAGRLATNDAVIALPARAGVLDRGQDRVLALARLPAGRARRRPRGRDRLLGAALPAHDRPPGGPGGASLPGPSRRCSRTLVLGAVTVELFAAGVLVAGRDYVTAAVATTASRSPGGGQALHILAEAGNGAGSSPRCRRSARSATPSRPGTSRTSTSRCREAAAGGSRSASCWPARRC